MRRAAYWLFPLIALAVAVFIVVFMIQINPAAPVLNTTSGGTETEVTSHFSPDIGNWIERFSSVEEKGYFYPVNELTLELDANDTLGKF